VTKLHEFKVELNPNQYGYSETQREAPKPKMHPLDRDKDGKKGGSPKGWKKKLVDAKSKADKV
jgi:hypothetical protein